MGDVTFDAGNARRWLGLLADALEEHREELTRLDSAIGDADHGTNMTRGFRAVRERVLGQDGADLQGVLRQTGMALISTVGGAGGPLYGTLFVRMGQAVAGREALTLPELRDALAAGVQGVVDRGKAQRGDKTMVDALGPAVEALTAAVDAGHEPAAALRQAAEAARTGAAETVPMLARKGRASYLGERSVGHQDPGATSSALLVDTLADSVG
jgi:dihydroxyacetone kinase-like protein